MLDIVSMVYAATGGDEPSKAAEMLFIIQESIPAILLSVFGGFVDLMTAKEAKASVLFWLGSLCCAAAVGGIIAFSLHSSDLNVGWVGAMCLVAGTMSRPLLAKIQTKFMDKVDKTDV